MTKKHFIMLARAIKAQQEFNYHNVKENEGNRATMFDFAIMLCEELKRENSLFDKNRFMKACGFE